MSGGQSQSILKQLESKYQITFQYEKKSSQSTNSNQYNLTSNQKFKLNLKGNKNNIQKAYQQIQDIIKNQ